MKHLSLFIFLKINLSIYTQTLKGVVLDSITNEQLPSANLGIKGKRIGVYSNDNGVYNLDISKASSKNTLVVSLIGYHTIKSWF